MATFSGTSDSDVIRPNQISDGVYADPAGSTPSNGVFDIIYGNDGYDTLDGGAGPDEIYGGEGPDRIEDNSYYNAFSPTEPNSGNKIHGNGGDDQITLWVPAVLESDNTAENIVYGGEGNDATNLDVILEEGAEGSNPLTGITTIFGGSGDDRVQGYTKSGSQTVDLSHAETRIYGEEGDDQLEASRLFTEELVGGGNREILYGGAGSDVYRVYEAIDTVVELEGEGTDEVIPYNMNYSLTDHVENMFVVYPSYSDNIIMSPFYQGNGLDNTMWGCELNETLCGAAGNDTIYGKWTGTHQAGTVDADVIHGGDGNDTLYGGGGPGETWDGNDTLYGDLGADTISGQDGNDQIYGGRSADDPADGPDTIYADVGNDNVWAGGGNDLVYGGSGDDNLYAQSGNDTIRGGAGNDRVYGGTGTDTLYGEDGVDNVRGGGVGDRCDGGGGNDRYQYESVSDSAPGATNRDVILAFANVGATAGDQIDLATIDANTGVGGNQAFVFKGTAAISGAGQVNVVASGGDTLIRANTGGTLAPELEIVVQDGTATPGQWVAGDFIL